LLEFKAHGAHLLFLSLRRERGRPKHAPPHHKRAGPDRETPVSPTTAKLLDSMLRQKFFLHFSFPFYDSAHGQKTTIVQPMTYRHAFPIRNVQPL
jgi:hypothetical protein